MYALCLLFMLIISVNSYYIENNIELYECTNKRNCKIFTENTKHFLIPRNITRVTKDIFNDTPDVISIMGSPGNIEEIEANSFHSLKKLVRIWFGGQKLTSIPYGVFSKLSIDYLYLAGNFIEVIETEALDLKELKYLFLDKNYLTQFDPGWFSEGPMKQFESLWCHHNKIRALNRKAFYKFPNIIKVDFSFNEIQYIADDLFNTTTLKDIDLSFNQLKVFNPNSLSNVELVNRLVLSFNYLRNIEPATFLRTNIKVIGIFPNKWLCACMFRTESLMNKLNITSEETTDVVRNKEFLDKYQSELKSDYISSKLSICFNSVKNCDERKANDTIYEKILTKTYKLMNPTCETDKDCSTAGILCKSNYCWPMILKIYFDTVDKDYFGWIFAG